jgi:hypothetical protein
MSYIIRVHVLFGVSGPGNTAYGVAPTAVMRGEPS